jgi:hypothetical protein
MQMVFQDLVNWAHRDLKNWNDDFDWIDWEQELGVDALHVADCLFCSSQFMPLKICLELQVTCENFVIGSLFLSMAVTIKSPPVPFAEDAMMGVGTDHS